jgi:NTP pyrophosphatase (non-canonical NTP hydrolase)
MTAPDLRTAAQALQERIGAWHRSRFPTAQMEHVHIKASEELGEVAEAVNARAGHNWPTGKPASSIEEEAADVVIALMVLVDRWCPGVDLLAEVERKVCVLEDPASGHRSSALAAEATEPPPCCAHPKDEHSYEGNPEADPRYEPMWCDHKDCPCPGWGMTGSAPNQQGADELLMVELQERLRRSFEVPPEILSGPDNAPSYLVRLYRAGYISPSNARRIASEMNAALMAEHNRAGSPPPTPAPTREQVAAMVDSFVPASPSVMPYFEGIRGRLIDAVLALSAEPAPPLWTGPVEDLALSSEDPDIIAIADGLPPGTAVEVRERTTTSTPTTLDDHEP